MSDTPFDMELTGEEAEAFGMGASEEQLKAKAVEALQQDLPSKEVPVEEGFKMVMRQDMPRDLWDIAGCTHFEFEVSGPEEAMAMYDNCKLLWESIREAYPDEVAVAKETAVAAEAITAGQVRYIEQLLEEREVATPEGYHQFTKTQASAIIDEMKKAPKKQKSGGWGGRSSGGGGRRSFGGGGAGATEKQLAAIQGLSTKLEIPLPSNFESLTKKEASDVIGGLYAKMGR